MELYLIILFFIVSYLFASIPFGYLVAKRKNIDIREHGSKNIGFTNVKRTLGWKYALPVLLLDFLKGVLPFWLATQFCSQLFSYQLLISLGIVVILGHVYPVWLKLKRSGKGIATTAGILAVIAPMTLLVAFVVFLITVAITRYISLGSLLGVLALLIYECIVNSYSILATILLSVFIIYHHRENIKRILEGTEHKFTMSNDKLIDRNSK